jgi:hypothetical protein
MISDTSFLSLRGAIFLAYASEQAPQSPSVIVRSRRRQSNLGGGMRLPRPDKIGARNDTKGYYPMLQAYKVSPIYLN